MPYSVLELNAKLVATFVGLQYQPSELLGLISTRKQRPNSKMLFSEDSIFCMLLYTQVQIGLSSPAQVASDTNGGRGAMPLQYMNY